MLSLKHGDGTFLKAGTFGRIGTRYLIAEIVLYKACRTKIKRCPRCCGLEDEFWLRWGSALEMRKSMEREMTLAPN